MSIALAQSFDPAERRTYLGASEVAAVCGFDKYRTPLDVYNDKLGLTAPFGGNNHTERGNRLERVAADIYTEISGNKLRRKTTAYTHPVYPFITGHIDRLVEGQRKIAEIKCPSLGAFRSHQRNGLPESYIIQMQMYLGLSGYSEGVWILFCADQMDIATFEVQFDPVIYNSAVEQAARFWTENVMTETPPLPVKDDKDKIEISKTGGTVTVREDQAFADAAELVAEAWRLSREADELKDLAKRKMVDVLDGESGIYEGAGLRLYYQIREGRKTFDKKALAAAHPDIDLSQFEKTGSPFAEFKPYFTNQN